MFVILQKVRSHSNFEMYSLSRIAVNGVVSPFPNHRVTLKSFSIVINLRNFNRLPMQKLKMSSSLNPNFVKQNCISLIPNFVKKNSSTLITELVKRFSSLVMKIMTVYVLFRVAVKLLEKCIFETVVRSKFRVGDHITTAVDDEEVGGFVELIGWFSTTIRMDNGNLFDISNGKFGSLDILRRAVSWKYDKDFEIDSIYVFWNPIKEEDKGLELGNILRKIYLTLKTILVSILESIFFFIDD